MLFFKKQDSRWAYPEIADQAANLKISGEMRIAEGFIVFNEGGC
jgi:hypothetical protein